MLKPQMTNIGWAVPYRDAIDETAKTAEEAKNRWHPYPQEKPTEDGWYVVWIAENNDWDTAYWLDDYKYFCNYDDIVTAWQKIEPYEEGV